MCRFSLSGSTEIERSLMTLLWYMIMGVGLLSLHKSCGITNKRTIGT